MRCTCSAVLARWKYTVKALASRPASATSTSASSSASAVLSSSLRRRPRARPRTCSTRSSSPGPCWRTSVSPSWAPMRPDCRRAARSRALRAARRAAIPAHGPLGPLSPAHLRFAHGPLGPRVSRSSSLRSTGRSGPRLGLLAPHSWRSYAAAAGCGRSSGSASLSPRSTTSRTRGASPSVSPSMRLPITWRVMLATAWVPTAKRRPFRRIQG